MGAAVQVLVGKAKSPVEETPEIVRGLDPVLVRVTVMGALVVFRFWLPKATGLGVAEAAAAATPVPLRGMVRGTRGIIGGDDQRTRPGSRCSRLKVTSKCRWPTWPWARRCRCWSGKRSRRSRRHRRSSGAGPGARQSHGNGCAGCVQILVAEGHRVRRSRGSGRCHACAAQRNGQRTRGIIDW